MYIHMHVYIYVYTCVCVFIVLSLHVLLKEEKELNVLKQYCLFYLVFLVLLISDNFIIEIFPDV